MPNAANAATPNNSAWNRPPPVHEIERERPGAKYLLHKNGAGHDARVGVVGREVGGPIGKVGEHKERQHDTKRRERAQVRAEDLHNLRVRPMLGGPVLWCAAHVERSSYLTSPESNRGREIFVDCPGQLRTVL